MEAIVLARPWWGGSAEVIGLSSATALVGRLTTQKRLECTKVRTTRTSDLKTSIQQSWLKLIDVRAQTIHRIHGSTSCGPISEPLWLPFAIRFRFVHPSLPAQVPISTEEARNALQGMQRFVGYEAGAIHVRFRKDRDDIDQLILDGESVWRTPCLLRLYPKSLGPTLY